jgi:hypothetical protein
MKPVTGPRRQYDPDQYSFVSDTTATTQSSDWTEAASSTIWGPGALTGKALVAFGKGTLRTVENAVIYRRLRIIKSHLSSKENEISSKSEQIYSDLIALCRCVLSCLIDET